MNDCISCVVDSCQLGANFSFSGVCLGDTTFFNDLSVDSLGNIVDWKWLFGDGDSLVGVQNPSHLYSASGNYNVTLIITNDSSCTDTISLPLTINPTFNINRNDTICQGDSILLGGSFQTVAGNYTDSLQTILGCDSVAVTTLQVDTIIVLTISDDTVSTPCNPVQLSVSGGSSYVWSPANGLSCVTCPNPIAIPETTIAYTVVESSNSCASQASVTVFVEGESDFIIPNVFTPNFDNNNDGFNVKSDCIYNLEKKIYNRWGQLLFHSNQINEPWNGRTTAGAEAPEGTYFYIIDVGFYRNGEKVTETHKGTVTLLR